MFYEMNNMKYHDLNNLKDWKEATLKFRNT